MAVVCVRNINKRILNNLTILLLNPRSKYAKITEVGKLVPLKKYGNYATGQLFLHKVFAYRGVILFPWEAKVYDRDIPHKKKNKTVTAAASSSPPPPPPPMTPPPPNSDRPAVDKKIIGRSHTFYQVLMDSRDFPYIRAQTEAVTFLGSKVGGRKLYAIPGLDYVSHDDILPYITKEKNPIHHELFDKFLTHQPSKESC